MGWPGVCVNCGGEQLKWAARRITAERNPGYADCITLLTAGHGAERKTEPEFSTALLSVSAGRKDFQLGSGGYGPRALMRRRRDTARAARVVLRLRFGELERVQKAATAVCVSGP